MSAFVRRLGRRLAADDAGFTLAELLVATVVMAIIMAPLTAVIYVGVHDTAQVVDGFYQSHDPQLASSFFSTDVQSSDSVYTTRIVQQGVNLHAATFSSPTAAWAVGDRGTIISSDSGDAFWSGDTWNRVDSGVTVNLYGVASPPNDAVHVWAVGDGGTILVTSDGGSTWTPQASNTTANLRAVYFLDSSNGIAVGTGGTILKTTNGGGTWSKLPAATSADLTSLSFYGDGTRGMIGSASGVTLASTDFFAHVTVQSNGTVLSGQVTGVFTYSDKLAWATVSTGSGGQVWKCTDHCKDNNPVWQQQAAGQPALNGIAGIDDTHVWAVGDQPTMLCYEPPSGSGPDAGLNSCDQLPTSSQDSWQALTGDPDATGDLQAVAALDQSHIVAVGTNGLIETASRSPWGPQTSPTGATLNAAWFKDSGNGVAVGAGGTLLTYTSGTWQGGPVAAFGGADLYAVSGKDMNNLWVAGSGGQVWYWNGASAVDVSPPDSLVPAGTVLRGLSYKDDTHVAVVGDGGTWLLCTANCKGGSPKWQPIGATALPDLRAVAYIDNSHVWAVGINGTRALCTSNCDKATVDKNTGAVTGNGSVTQYPGTGTYRALQVKDSGHIWLAGSSGVEYWNGTAWAVEWPGDFRGLAMLDPKHVFAVGAGGRIAACTDHCDRADQGVWQNQDSGVSAALNAVVSPSGSAQWAFGDGGRILTTISGSTSWFQDDQELLADIPSPVCLADRDPLISFAWDDGSGTGSLNAAGYYLSGDASPALERVSCTVTQKDPANATAGYDVSNLSSVTLGHFLGAVDDSSGKLANPPTVTCDGQPAADGCESARLVRLVVPIDCVPLDPSNKSLPVCPGNTSKVQLPSPWSFTLSATRRAP